MTEAAGEVVPHHKGPDQDRIVQGLFQDLQDWAVMVKDR